MHTIVFVTYSVVDQKCVGERDYRAFACKNDGVPTGSPFGTYGQRFINGIEAAGVSEGVGGGSESSIWALEEEVGV